MTEAAILVTGGAGFVGAHTVKALDRAGFPVVVYDNLFRGKQQRLQWGLFEEGDIRDRDRLDQVIKTYQPSAVLNFAGLTYVDESMSEPDAYYSVNVEGLRNVAAACCAGGVKKLVFSSSCSIFGNGGDKAVTEDAAFAPQSPYATSKLIGEMLLADFDQAYGLKSACLRYFNAAGADPEGDIGESDDAGKRVLPNLIKAWLARDKNQVFTVFGTDYDTRDGSALRDYVHVSDLADAHVRALQHLFSKEDSFAVNLGSGAGTTVLELVERFRAATDDSLNIKTADRRHGDPAAAFADPTRAENLLSWRAERSDIDMIIKDALSWFSRQNTDFSS